MTDKTDKINETAAPESEKTPSRFRRFWGRKRILTLAVLAGCVIAASWFVLFSALGTEERERAANARLFEDFPQAILDGDGETALELAEKIDDSSLFVDDYNFPSLCRGVAFELNGEYEKSLEAYRLAGRAKNRDKVDAEPSGVDSFLGRVYYRLDRRADAFAAYCRLTETALKRAKKTSEDFRFDEARARPWALEFAKRRVLFAYDAQGERSPLDLFADYDEFLSFVGSEYERAAEPEKYEAAVQFWRDAAAIDLTSEARPRLVFAVDDDGYFFDCFLAIANQLSAENLKEKEGTRALESGEGDAPVD